MASPMISAGDTLNLLPGYGNLNNIANIEDLVSDTESYSGSRDYPQTDRTRDGDNRNNIIMTFHVVYKSADVTIHNRGLDDSQSSVGLKYGKEPSNRTRKPI